MHPPCTDYSADSPGLAYHPRLFHFTRYRPPPCSCGTRNTATWKSELSLLSQEISLRPFSFPELLDGSGSFPPVSCIPGGMLVGFRMSHYFSSTLRVTGEIVPVFAVNLVAGFQLMFPIDREPAPPLGPVPAFLGPRVLDLVLKKSPSTEDTLPRHAQPEPPYPLPLPDKRTPRLLVT